MLPVPMVADSEVMSALKGEMSPSPRPCATAEQHGKWPPRQRRTVSKRSPRER
jgi:hypothetical protein